MKSSFKWRKWIFEYGGLHFRKFIRDSISVWQWSIMTFIYQIKFLLIIYFLSNMTFLYLCTKLIKFYNNVPPNASANLQVYAWHYTWVLVSPDTTPEFLCTTPCSTYIPNEHVITIYRNSISYNYLLFSNISTYLKKITKWQNITHRTPAKNPLIISITAYRKLNFKLTFSRLYYTTINRWLKELDKWYFVK